jgi:hypothetical protein
MEDLLPSWVGLIRTYYLVQIVILLVVVQTQAIVRIQPIRTNAQTREPASCDLQNHIILKIKF